VYDSYGKKCNSRFLLNYGFIVENNDGNEFPITVEIEDSDPHFTFKKNFLQNDSMKKTFRVQVSFQEQAVIDFLSMLRFKLFGEDINELFNIIVTNKNKSDDEDSKPNFYTIPPISIKNEIKVLENIEKVANECLLKYPQTLEVFNLYKL
jgi:histone-lysine N-methyltransferase SETD3